MALSSAAEVLQSVGAEPEPPEGISEELRALWLARKGDWHAAHEIVNGIPSSMGSWIHAHLHVLEGDLGNAGYWYSKAGKPPRPPEEADDEWVQLVEANL